MNPFKLRTLYSYSPAVIRFLIGIAEFLTGTLRDSLFPIDSPLLSILLVILCPFGLSNIIFALIEIQLLREHRCIERRRKMLANQVRTLDNKLFPAKKVLAALEREPVLDLLIVANDRLVSVCSASDCRVVHDSRLKSHTEFFDKAYYIDDIEESEYSSFDKFSAALIPYIQNGSICVHKVDSILISKLRYDPFDI